VGKHLRQQSHHLDAAREVELSMRSNKRFRAMKAMTRRKRRATAQRAAGFSLIELIIAMTVTLVLMAAACTLLAQALGIRTRENKRSDALADAQRALNIMSREIANSGFGLTDNGIVAADSGASAIRVRANLNGDAAVDGTDEDVTYVYQATPLAIVRYDRNAGAATSLASAIDSLTITYFDNTGAVIANNPLAAANAPNVARVRIALSVTLRATQGQPASSVQLTSDVALRNSAGVLSKY
jgi:prepilin-type N-terminal cleavage/methylation domain-containing protein